MEKKERNGLYVDLHESPELARRIRVFAAANGVSLKQIAIEAFTAYLDKQEKKGKKNEQALDS